MAKTVFGIPGADTSQPKSGGAVAPKGVHGGQSGQSMPQKAGNVAIPGASRGLPVKPPAGKPVSLPPTLPPAPPIPATTSVPPPPISQPLEADADPADQGAVDVQGKTVFGMPAMKIPMQESQPQPQDSEPGEAELEPLWPKSERAAVPPTGTSTMPPPAFAEPIDELSASMLEPELSSEEQISAPASTDEPTGEDSLETARMPVMSSVAPPARAAGWVWALVIAGALALAAGSGWLVWQMIQGGGGLGLPEVEAPASPDAQN